MEKVQVLSHPLVSHKISLIRNKETKSKQFRELLNELSTFLVFECTRDLELKSTGVVMSPMGPFPGQGLKDEIGLFPILRAGCGLLSGFQEMLPSARVHHLGLYREKSTFLPVEYYNKLPSKCTIDVGFVLDPMIATAGTAIAAVSILKDWGLKRIKFCAVVASRDGIEALYKAHPDIEIYVCVIDDILTDMKYIVPGLGDAGDRIFKT